MIKAIDNIESPLYAITDSQSMPGSWCEHIDAAVDAGICLIQIREKNWSDKHFFYTSKMMHHRHPHVTFLLNHRPHIASSLKNPFIGTHISSFSDFKDIKSEMVVGFSAHSCNDIDRWMAHVSFCVLSPIFPPLSKPLGRGQVPLGTGIFDEISHPHRVFALGGMTHTRVAAMKESAICCVASIGALWGYSPQETGDRCEKMLSLCTDLSAKEGGQRRNVPT